MALNLRGILFEYKEYSQIVTYRSRIILYSDDAFRSELNFYKKKC